jgi:hypothetical protein
MNEEQLFYLIIICFVIGGFIGGFAFYLISIRPLSTDQIHLGTGVTKRGLSK